MQAKLCSFVLIAILFLPAAVTESGPYIDSLNREMNQAKNMTRKMLYQTEIARVMDDKDSAERIFENVMNWAVEAKEQHVEMMVNLAWGEVYMHDNSEWDDAIHFFERSELLAGQLQDTLHFAKSKRYEGDVWELKKGYAQAGLQYLTAEQLLQINTHVLDSRTDKNFLGELGHVYQEHAGLFEQEGKLDSAQIFEKRAVNIFGRIGWNSDQAGALANLAAISSKQNNHQEAIQLLNLSLDVCTADDEPEISSGLSQLGLEYSATGNYKMARQKADSALVVARNINAPKEKANAFQALAAIYEKGSDFKGALYYSDSAALLNREILSQQSDAKIASAHEKYRRETEKIKAEKAQAMELRKNNIQLVGIGIFLVTGLVFVIALMRKKYSAVVARALGAIGLLLMFELISLLAHPLMERLTNHSAVYMVLILVAFAALIVPFHHRIEDQVRKWVHAG